MYKKTINKCMKSAPSLLKLIKLSNFELLLAFMERERKDFGSKIEKIDLDYIESTIKNIEKEIKPVYEIRFESLGNTGVVLRTLALDTDYVESPLKKMTVTFCTCGKPSCWGSTRIEDF